MLADKMKAAGNDVAPKLYAGVTHEFFGMDAVVAKAKEAQDFAVSQLQKGFSAPAGTVGNATSGSSRRNDFKLTPAADCRNPRPTY